MPHSLIRLAAIGLTVLLVLFSLAFAYAAGQREQRLAAQAASAPSTSAAFDPVAAAASFEGRCTKCHEMDEMTDWLKPQAAPGRLSAMKVFLESHRKAPPAENDIIATYLAGAIKD